MNRTRIGRGFRAVAAAVVLLLLFGFFPEITALHVAAEDLEGGGTIKAHDAAAAYSVQDYLRAWGEGTRKRDNVKLTYLKITSTAYVDGAQRPTDVVLYEYDNGKETVQAPANIELLPDAVIHCWLDWEAKDYDDVKRDPNFAPGDYFVFPIMKVDTGTWNINPKTFPLYLDPNDTASQVGEGAFGFESSGLLYYRVDIDDPLVLGKAIEGGDAFNYAGLKLTETTEKITFSEDRVTQEYKVAVGSGGTIRGRDVNSPTVDILKSDAMAGLPHGAISESVFEASTGIAGIEFEVYRYDSSKTDNLGDQLRFRQSSVTGVYTISSTGTHYTVKTDAKGKLELEFVNADLGKKMVLKEVNPPAEYAPADLLVFDVPSASSGSGALVHYNVNNRSNSVLLVKKDQNRNPITSGRARFRLERSTDSGTTWADMESFDVVDSKYYRYNAASGPTELWTVNGELRIALLPDGAYRLTELQAPGGYTLSSETKEFTLSGSAGTLIELEFLNRSTGGGGGGSGGGGGGSGGGGGGGTDKRDEGRTTSTKEVITEDEEEIPLSRVPDDDSGMSSYFIEYVPETGGNRALPLLAMLMALSGAIVAIQLLMRD